jgi:uncharacterized protein (DUF433 family)
MPDRFYITLDPRRSGGEPCIRGTGLRTELIAGCWWAGRDVEDICEDYQIERGDILIACWYMAGRGSLKWRKRWGDWLKDAEAAMFPHAWAAWYALCPLPPQKGE